jgi:hypothetical protein
MHDATVKTASDPKPKTAGEETRGKRERKTTGGDDAQEGAREGADRWGVAAGGSQTNQLSLDAKLGTSGDSGHSLDRTPLRFRNSACTHV